jgi:hypothetical protein
MRSDPINSSIVILSPSSRMSGTRRRKNKGNPRVTQKMRGGVSKTAGKTPTTTAGKTPGKTPTTTAGKTPGKTPTTTPAAR